MLSDLRHDLRIYRFAAGMGLRAQLHHRRAFAFGVIAQGLTAVTDFAAIVILIMRFGAIGGWSLPQLGLLYGLVASSLSLALLLGSGIGDLDGLLRNGEFDRIRTRPCGSLWLVAGSRFEVRRLGRVAQGLLVLAWAVWRVGAMDATALMVVAALLGGGALFLGLQVIQASASFWFREGCEVFNVFSYGGETLGAYPLPIFQRWLQHLLLGVIPVAAISYLPALVLTHRCAPGWPTILAASAPLLGVAFFGASLMLWRCGLRRFGATG